MASVLDVCDWKRRKWKLLVLLSALQATFHQAVAGSCGNDDDKSGKRNKGDDNCWYELWYFWFILVLAFLTIVVLVIFYCKQQVKRSSGRRGRRRTPVLTMPMAPPQYEAPGHQPPPYHIAMSTTVPAGHCPPHSGTSTRSFGQPGSAPYTPSQQAATLPGYVVQPHDPSFYDNISLASTLSVGAFSNPPPYSPPPTSGGGRQRQELTDVVL